MNLQEAHESDLFLWHGTTLTMGRAICREGKLIADTPSWENGEQAPVEGCVYLGTNSGQGVFYATKRGGKAATGALIAVRKDQIDMSKAMPDEDEICQLLCAVWTAEKCPWKIEHIIDKEELALGDRLVSFMRESGNPSLSLEWDDIMARDLDPEYGESDFYKAAAELGKMLPEALKAENPELFDEVFQQASRIRVPAPVQIEAAWRIPLDYAKAVEGAIPLNVVKPQGLAMAPSGHEYPISDLGAGIGL